MLRIPRKGSRTTTTTTAPHSVEALVKMPSSAKTMPSARLAAVVCLVCFLILFLRMETGSLTTVVDEIMHPPLSVEEKARLSIEHSSSYAHPVDLKPWPACASVRFRDVPSTTMDIPEAAQYIHQVLQSHPSALKIGLTIIEDNKVFWGLNGKGYMHLFHYLEFLLWGYKSLMELVGDNGAPSLQNNGVLQVQWVHAPFLLRTELEGSQGINKLMTALALRTTSDPNVIPFKGLEDNDELTRSLHESFSGGFPWFFHKAWIWKVLPTRENRRKMRIPDAATRQRNWHAMTEAVDAVLFIDRMKCDQQAAHQMHAKLSDDGQFPAEAWNLDIWNGVETTTQPATLPEPLRELVRVDTTKLVACYVDRQKTDRKMPQFEHEFLVQTLSEHPQVHFKHLFMEKFSGLEQIQIAKTCNLLVGVHGNGLSHQVWMKPGSYVVEYFWNNAFVFCYSILARMMKHAYLGFWRGKKMDDRVLQKNATVFEDYTLYTPVESPRKDFLEFLEHALADFSQKQQHNN